MGWARGRQLVHTQVSSCPFLVFSGDQPSCFCLSSERARAAQQGGWLGHQDIRVLLGKWGGRSSCESGGITGISQGGHLIPESLAQHPSAGQVIAPTAALTHYPWRENFATAHSATSCLSYQHLSSFGLRSDLLTLPTSPSQCLTPALGLHNCPLHTLGFLLLHRFSHLSPPAQLPSRMP